MVTASFNCWLLFFAVESPTSDHLRQEAEKGQGIAAAAAPPGGPHTGSQGEAAQTQRISQRVSAVLPTTFSAYHIHVLLAQAVLFSVFRYALFYKDTYSKLRAENPEWKASQIMAEAGKIWKEMNGHGQDSYRSRYAP